MGKAWLCDRLFERFGEEVRVFVVADLLSLESAWKKFSFVWFSISVHRNAWIFINSSFLVRYYTWQHMLFAADIFHVQRALALRGIFRQLKGQFRFDHVQWCAGNKVTVRWIWVAFINMLNIWWVPMLKSNVSWRGLKMNLKCPRSWQILLWEFHFHPLSVHRHPPAEYFFVFQFSSKIDLHCNFCLIRVFPAACSSNQA